MTISQVVDPAKQPRVAFRANKRINGQAWLTGLPKPEQDEPAGGTPHILLLHGHQSLNFSHLALPREDQQKGYHYRSPNLMLMPHIITSPEPPPEDTDIEAIITLKEEIDKWRRDNDD